MADEIIDERKQKHEEAMKRRKRINQERSNSGKTKEELRESDCMKERSTSLEF